MFLVSSLFSSMFFSFALRLGLSESRICLISIAVKSSLKGIPPPPDAPPTSRFMGEVSTRELDTLALPSLVTDWLSRDVGRVSWNLSSAAVWLLVFFTFCFSLFRGYDLLGIMAGELCTDSRSSDLDGTSRRDVFSCLARSRTLREGRGGL